MAVLVGGYAAAESGSTLARSGGTGAAATNEGVVPPRENVTVVATDSTAFLTDEGDGPRKRAELVAFAPNGSVSYRNESHTRYWDVDPVAGTNATVEYLYADHLSPEDCNSGDVCTRNGVERVNLTTGNVTSVYSRVTPGKHSTRWHDADRIDEDRLLVADIAQDRAFVVNTTTEQVTWSWDAQTEFETSIAVARPSSSTYSTSLMCVQSSG